MWFQPGAVVADAFRVERELGRGAMGVVLLANHLALDRLVALKVHRAQNPADVSRLAREAKAMAKVRHPNVVGIYDVRESGGSLFIAMEYIEGCSARRWLAQPGVAWRQRLDVCVQAAKGLQAAHAAGLVHRDFKPENILIGNDGRVLVADFGLARAPGAVPADPATPSPGIDAQLTAVGQVTGTPAYMSPEQWSGGAVDARSDVFALSVVFYEALYGRRPFSGTTPSDLVFQITRGMVLDPPAQTEVPKAVFDVLRRGMAVDPQYRFGSAAMLVRAVQSATSSAGRTGIALALGLAVLVFGGIGGIAWAIHAQSQGVVMIETDEEEAADPVEPPVAIRPRPVIERRPPVEPEPEPEPPPAVVVPPKEPEPPAFDVPSQAEIDAASAALADVSEKHAHGLATQAEVIAATKALHDVLRRSRDERYTPTAWDGKSTFVCSMGDRVELRDVNATVDVVAIRMEMGCGLRLVNVNLDAPVGITGTTADRLIIEGGTFNVSRKGIELSMAEVEIRDLTIEGKPLVGIELGMHTLGTIEDTTVEGLTALRLGMHTDIEMRGGKVAGKVAVDAQMRAYVKLKGVAVDGEIKRGMKARVEQATRSSSP